MGINTVWFCFNDKRDTEKELFDAAYTEIQNRLSMYNKLLYSGHGEEEAVNKCKLLLTKLDEQKTHIVHQRYNSEMKWGICVWCTV